MRIVKKGEREAVEASLKSGSPTPPDVSKTVQLGSEDLVLGVIILVLIIGYVRGQLTIQDLLAYLGVSGAGGLWGMLGGSASSKT